MQSIDTLLLVVMIVVAGPTAIHIAALALSPGFRKEQVTRWRSEESSRILRSHASDATRTSSLGTRAGRQRTMAADQLGRERRVRTSAR
jgi:hypothetical protein